MARQWRKLHSKLIHSKNLNMAAYDDPLAERLWFRMIAACDDYGRLPGDPWKLKSQIAPMLPESIAQIADAVAVLEKHDLLQLYDVDDEPYLLLNHWFEYQDLKWFAVGAPTYPHPENWQAPESLLQWIADHNDSDTKYSPNRYGLDNKAVMAQLSGASTDTTTDGSVDVSTEGTDIDVDVDTETTTTRTTKARADSDAAPEDKPLTPQQQTIRSAWDAFGLEEPYGDAEGNKPGFSGLTKLVAEHGIPVANAWAATIKRSPPEKPEGAEKWAWFKQQFRAAMNRPWEWQPQRGKSGKTIPARKDAEYGEPGPIKL